MSLSDEEIARIVFLERLDEDINAETIQRLLLPYGKVIHVQFWNSLHGNRCSFVTFRSPSGAEQALERFDSNRAIKFVIKPPLPNSLHKYERPPSSNLFEATLKLAVDRLEDENRMYREEIRFIKENNNTLSQSLKDANETINQLRDEQGRLAGQLKEADRTAARWREEYYRDEEKLEDRRRGEAELRRRLEHADSVIASNRYALSTNANTIAGYRERLSEAERRLEETRLQAGLAEEGEIKEVENLVARSRSPRAKSPQIVELDDKRFQAVAPTLAKAFILLDKITSDILKDSGSDGHLSDGPTRKKRKLDGS